MPPNRRRWWRSVRMRTAIAATLALAPALALVSVAGVLYQRHQLEEGIALVAEEHARSVDATGSGPELNVVLGGESALVQVIDARGDVVAASAALRGEPALVDPADVSATTRLTVTGVVKDEDDRYLAVAVPAADGRVVVAVQSLESVDTATSSTIGLLAVGDPLLVLLVALLSYVLVGRALRPVESLRAEATEITAADLAARLPVPPTGDEIERLSVTLNDMLARLQASATAQRRFVADASHELRSPIATIRTLHEVAAADRGTDWPMVSTEVLTETARLERLVADLLLLARSGPATPPAYELLDLSEVVRAEVARARRVPPSPTSPTMSSSSATPTSSPRQPATSLTTPSDTHAPSSRSPSPPSTTGRRSGSATTAPAWPRPTGSGSSTGSSGWTRPARATTAAPGSASPSPGCWSRSTMARSGSTRHPRAARCSSSTCPWPRRRSEHPARRHTVR